MNEDFFKEMTDQSIIKSEIVSKYFYAWSKIIGSKGKSDRIGYIDLFCGPGTYENGEFSTPIKILQTCISDDLLRNKVIAIFNDANKEHVEKLSDLISSLPGIESLKYKPKVLNKVVGNEIANIFKSKKLIPLFAFVDPWGYKGLTLDLIKGLTKDWGSDCVFFFNYNRINAGINNYKVQEHIKSIFGEDRANKLKEIVSDLNPYERELTIINELAKALNDNGNNYVLPFKFGFEKVSEGKERTSHYLIFVSKHVLGYTIMKGIMGNASSEHHDGVASFSFIPIKEKEMSKIAYEQLDLLRMYFKPLDNLGEELLNQFKGKILTTKQIFDSHHIGTPFIKANYQEALRRLEAEGKIITDPPADKRRSRNGIKTFSDNVEVTFV